MVLFTATAGYSAVNNKTEDEAGDIQVLFIDEDINSLIDCDIEKKSGDLKIEIPMHVSPVFYQLVVSCSGRINAVAKVKFSGIDLPLSFLDLPPPLC